MTLLLPFGVSLLLCLLLLSPYSPLKILDQPNERSLHATPTPRTGGVAIVIAIFVSWLWLGRQAVLPDAMLYIVSAATVVAAISLLDDFREQSPLVRLIAHSIAAGLLIGGGLSMFSGWAGMLFSAMAIIWMLNLYNFMDGMDGFAGGMSFFGFSFLAAAGWLQGSEAYALYTAVIAMAALGFLPLNFPPAKIFMGDVGSATLGLLAGAFSLWGMQLGLFGWWFPLLVFSPFVVDATVTLTRRLLRRERVWEAHRSHYYQQLVQLGWGHKKTVIIEYMVMMTTGTSALAALMLDNSVVVTLVLAGWAFAYVLIAVRVRYMVAGVEI